MEETELPDGRRAQLWTGGAAGGPTVLVCHGTPDTRWVARTGRAAATAVGVRLLSVNRPGYGTSTPARSTMSSVADDTVALLDALGLDRVAVLGMSVGGAYAAALAARHPDRVAALAVVAAPLEARTAMGPAEAMVEQARPEFQAWAATVGVADPDDSAVAARWLGALPPADAALLGRGPHDRRAGRLGARGPGLPRRLPPRRRPALRRLGLPTSRRPRAPPTSGTAPRRPQPTHHRPVVGRPLPRAELHVTPTTHLATLLTNWGQILRGSPSRRRWPGPDTAGEAAAQRLTSPPLPP